MNLQDFKIQVSLYQQRNKCKRSVALHAVAKELGYKNYNAYLATVKLDVKKEKEQSFEEKIKNLSLRMKPKYIFFGPIKDRKTGKIIERPDRPENFTTNTSEPIFLGTGKKTYYEAMWNDVRKKLFNPNSKLLTGYLPEDKKPSMVIKDETYGLDFGDSSNDVIESFKNYFGYHERLQHLKIKKQDVFIPDETEDRKKYFYKKRAEILNQKNKENISLEDVVKFITDYEEIMIKIHKEDPNGLMCGCLGPKNGEPFCPCKMKTVFKIDNMWFNVFILKGKICLKPYIKDVKHNIVFYVNKNKKDYILTN